MSRTPDYMYRVSERLSEVMDDIGVNEGIVMKTRRTHLLMENIETLGDDSCNATSYHFGSQSEGSTTIGLESDRDILMSMNIYNIIQNMSELKPGVDNLMMIQHENISPGYCYLQFIRPDLPIPPAVSDIDNKIMEHCVTDSEGRLLVKNTRIRTVLKMLASKEKLQIHGPALTTPEKHGAMASDTVMCFYCESPPHQVISWLQKQRGCKWPTEDVLGKCRHVGCFVLAVGSKVSYEPEFEWRISTSLHERYLMFSLNITQLRCYILMKMILKTHIDPHVEDVLSSYMCKNVLLYCIANSSHDWQTGNLLSYLHLYLFMLKECVEQRNCPHFMIPENNLLAGQMTDTQRGKILDVINNLMKNNSKLLFDIQIDDLGMGLMKLTEHEVNSQNILTAAVIFQRILCDLLYITTESQSEYLNQILIEIYDESLEMAQQKLFNTLSALKIHRREGDFYRRTASELLIPHVSSTLGSVLASSNIASHTAISEQAFTFLEAGKESDALSGRLKLVSVLYCTGDMESAESELRIIETQYNLKKLHAVFCCHRKIGFCDKLEFMKPCDDYIEEAIKSRVAFTTRFTPFEINCVPYELRYETLRSYIEEDRQMRTVKDSEWMDLIVVDSVPYLYFLQYKTYGHLQRRTEQIQALSNLAQSIYLDPNLGHKDSTLNLLGQCMEQENRQTEAFLCYILSLRCRMRNNAATFLLCIQLFKLWKQYNAL